MNIDGNINQLWTFSNVLSPASFRKVPVVPNTRIYKACLELARKMDICLLQQKTINILKERKLAQPELLQSSSTPYELKQICYVLNLNKTQYNYLYALLNKTI